MTSYFTRVSITGPESAPSDFPSILSFVPRPSGQNVYWPVRFPGPDSPSKRRDVEPWITILREDLPRMHTTSDIPSPSELKAFTRLAFESADFATFRRIRIDYFDFRPLLRFFSLRMLTAQTLEKKETRLTARAETLVPFSRLDRRFVWNNEASKYRNDAVILLEERNSICSRRASTTSFYFCRANHQEARNVDERRDERVTFHSSRSSSNPSFVRRANCSGGQLRFEFTMVCSFMSHGSRFFEIPVASELFLVVWYPLLAKLCSLLQGAEFVFSLLSTWSNGSFS